jgi:distribution and morphology protein 10
MSGAYSARVSPDLSLSSRFDFNVYSFESEWALGAEWWMRRRLSPDDLEELPEPKLSPAPSNIPGEIYGVVKGRVSTSGASATSFIILFLISPFAGCVSHVGRATSQHDG